MTLDIVVGGMYGSEAKGHATQRLVERRLQQTTYGKGFNLPMVNSQDKVWNVRIGGPNAGHTGYDAEGNPWAFRQVPVGVLVPGPVNLEIGAGSEIDLPVLLDEVDRCLKAGLFDGKRLVVHGEATLIQDRHKEQEAELVGRIGSTGKGIGAARAERLLRKADRLIDNEPACFALLDRGVEVTYSDSGSWRPEGSSVIVEGVQGYALGLHSGYYPKCTTSDCRAVDFLSMAGISPWDSRYVDSRDDLTVWVVARIYPIRVAGWSGPMKNERSWEDLGLPEERTTVTQKVRRVGLPDWELLAQAVQANGTSRVKVALSMVDQAYPEVRDLPYDPQLPAWDDAEMLMQEVEAQVKAPISLVMSGPNTAAFR